MAQPPICLRDFELNAKAVLPRAVWDYYASGANDEETMRDNETAFKRYILRPRILRDVSTIDTRCTILGSTIRSPICLAPSAMHCMAHEMGERATAAAAAKFGSIMTLSSYATTSLEDVPAGYKALVLTVDAPILGRRFANAPNFDPKLRVTTGTARAAARLAGNLPANGKTFSETFGNTADMSLCWEKDIAWLRSVTKMAIDAELACQYGVDAIWVSNHGGRQLDGALSTIDALAEIVNVIEVYVDGGIRHGSDVFKAMALGAMHGEDGLRMLLELLQTEFINTMALAGCTNISEITSDYVRTVGSIMRGKL
ncbi:hypothetical protein BDF22DRAFT_664390 [Syncephalis plumigaleata]|nr:hypothetical protein BDF22DRAFT_664390 [Syncephalis plumigaleata]